MNAEVFIFTNQFVCLGRKCVEYLGSKRAWETHSEHCVQSEAHQVQFDWRIFQGRTTTKNLPEIKEMMAEKGTSPSESQGTIVCMTMFNDFEWWKIRTN